MTRVDSTVAMGQTLPDRVIDAAIAWSIRLEQGRATVRVRQEFERWLAADARHQQAWVRIGMLREDIAQVPAGLARQTLQNARSGATTPPFAQRRAAIKLLSYAGLLTLSGMSAYRYTPWQRLVSDMSTSTGERKTWHLSDGTQIVLNTDSAVSTHMDDDIRLIILRRGEVMIDTGRDSETPTPRPFWVATPYGRVHALGTRFVLRMQDEGVRVAVQQDAVRLYPAQSSETATLHAGDSGWLFAEATAPAAQQGFGADAWVDGLLTTKNMRMAELLVEFDRYRPGRIFCDARIADLRVSGVFHLNNIDHALQTLALTQPIGLTYRTRYLVSVGPRVRGQDG